MVGAKHAKDVCFMFVSANLMFRLLLTMILFVLYCTCSGIHRSMGVHISKVRSFTLDKWDADLLKVARIQHSYQITLYQIAVTSLIDLLFAFVMSVDDVSWQLSIECYL